jgi:hypothetical protein
MKTVNIHYKLTYNQFLDVKQITFESQDADLAKDLDKTGKKLIEGDLYDILIVGKLDVYAYLKGIPDFKAYLDVTVDGTKLTQSPIELIINGKGVCSYTGDFVV